jgi:hypothetical protein
MAFYLIGYERRGVRPYDGLQEAIDREGGVHLIDNLWALESTREAAELRDWVHGLMDDSDAIFVIQVKKDQHWASRHLKTSVNDWLKARL